jgi:hypothetical protein
MNQYSRLRRFVKQVYSSSTFGTLWFSMSHCTDALRSRLWCGSTGIVVDEPLAQLLVEPCEVGKEQIFVPIDELLLDGSVEALAVGIHAR